MAANMMRGGTKNLKLFTVETLTTYDNGKQVADTQVVHAKNAKKARESFEYWGHEVISVVETPAT